MDNSPDLPVLPPRAEARIRIVGLGPGDLGTLTLDAWRTLTAAPAATPTATPRLLLRTRRHPGVAELERHVACASCDDLYEQHREFADVYAAIAGRVLALAQQGPLVYAVPGDPWVGEATTRLILEQARAAGLSVDVIGGVSFLPACFAAAGVDPMDGGQVVDGMLLARQHHPQVEVRLPLLIGQVYARWLASEVKLTLMNAYPDEHPVTVVTAAGTAAQRTHTLPLHELDRQELFDHLTTVYVPPLPAGGSFTDLQEIVAHLRAPEGCPWDREQTLASLRQDLLGECVEVLEAIDAEVDGEDNGDHIAEELGDLLLVPAMMAQIATEEGRFHMADVTHGIVSKLIRRHPHVFGDAEVAHIDDVWRNWDAIKAEERRAKGRAEPGPLDGVPPALPALEKARKLQSKAAKAGLLDRDALARANPALARLLGSTPDAERLGEVLWQLVALAHQHGLNAEDALRAYAVRFRERRTGKAATNCTN